MEDTEVGSGFVGSARFFCRRSRLALFCTLTLGGIFIGYFWSLGLKLSWQLGLTALALFLLYLELGRGWRDRPHFVYNDGEWFLARVNSLGELEAEPVAPTQWWTSPWLVAIRFTSADGKHHHQRIWRDALDEHQWQLLPSLLSLSG